MNWYPLKSMLHKLCSGKLINTSVRRVFEGGAKKFEKNEDQETGPHSKLVRSYPQI